MRRRLFLASLAIAALAPAAATSGTPAFSKEQASAYAGDLNGAAHAAYDRFADPARRKAPRSIAERIVYWHDVMLDANALDHTPNPATGAADLAQGGPVRTGRAFAMTTIAVFDAVNAFRLAYEPYNDIGRAPHGASPSAAIASAAHATLVALYPNQAPRLDLILRADLGRIDGSRASIAAGRALGRKSANAILARRAADGSQHAEVNFGEGGKAASGDIDYYGRKMNSGSQGPFDWTPDPLTPDPNSPTGVNQLALGAYWGAVTPFVMARGDAFRAPPPPAPGSPAHLAGYNEVKTVGAAPGVAGGAGTARTRFIGNYWGYDGAPLLGTPPRLYGQIAVAVARAEKLTDPAALARYLAMVHVAGADAGIAVWDSKFFYNYWRPVTAIRRADDDGVPGTIGDRAWSPFGISMINTGRATRGTPPFPAYPSGHAGLGAAAFGVMRAHFGDATPFTFVSDEYDGTGVDPFGVPRPRRAVRYRTLREAQDENGQSRIYNGVHWQWDNGEGQKIGDAIADQVLTGAFQPRR